MSNTFNLKEITECCDEKREIEIPSLQRGLVWKPRQIEFLWDSILRFFPIGGFVVANNDGKYDLMDGQQRFNAIHLGFEGPKKDANTILWLDVAKTNKDVPNSTRNFFIKATTKSHPWGYKDDDNSSLLSADERRKALKSFYGAEDRNIYNFDVNLLETYPFVAKCPIPLSFILDFTLTVDNAFNNVKAKLDAFSSAACGWRKAFYSDEEQKSETLSYLRRFLDSNTPVIVDILKNYAVPFSELPVAAFESETDNVNLQTGQTELEVLFTRLNTLGTKISQTDLSYSAIKAYWGTIKDKNNSLSMGFMPPQVLIMLLFRLYISLSKKDKEKFEPNLSIKRIREIAKAEKDKDTREGLIDFYNNDAERVVLSAKQIMDEIPSYVQMQIATTRPDIILLLFYFVSKFKVEDLKKINTGGLLLFLFWFAKDILSVVNAIFKMTKDDGDVNNLFKNICEVIQEFSEKEKIHFIYTPEELRSVLMRDDALIDNYKSLAEFQFLLDTRIFYDKTFLLYAQRKYLRERFSKYNPADTISWEDQNRPWDYDHIMPQAWTKWWYRTNEKAMVDYWLNSIGNLAAIPFEVNRAKNQNADWIYYEEHKEELYFDVRFKKLNNQITKDYQMASLFENVAFARLMKLYGECFAAFSNFLTNEYFTARKEALKKRMQKANRNV